MNYLKTNFVLQINQDYFEDLNESNTKEIIQKILNDEFPQPGSAKNRKSNAPNEIQKTLMEVKNA
jgi:hypothetical protein